MLKTLPPPRNLIASLLVCLAVPSAPFTLVELRAAEPDVMFHQIKANKIVFLGNSITLHGPAPAIGWLGNWGMAASSKDKDYVHLVLKAISQTAGREPQSMVVNVANFERHYATYDVDSGLAKELAFKPDLVIVAMGENVPALTTEEAKAAFKASTARLLRKLKENSDPVIVVRSCFWPNEPKDTILKQTCEEVGGIFVDAGARAKDQSYFARSERQFSHAGVAAHPGDRGMKAIAEAILEAMRQNEQ